MPAELLAEDVPRGCRQHRDGQDRRGQQADRQDVRGERPGDRRQRPGGLLRRLHGRVVFPERGAGAGEQHPEAAVAPLTR